MVQIESDESAANGNNGNITPYLTANGHHTKSKSNNNILSLRYSLSQFDVIKTKRDWESHLLTLFDTALPDIFHNLEDAMIRFRKTKEFQSLTDR